MQALQLAPWRLMRDRRMKAAYLLAVLGLASSTTDATIYTQDRTGKECMAIKAGLDGKPAYDQSGTVIYEVVGCLNDQTACPALTTIG